MVALLAEGVDRNAQMSRDPGLGYKSPSSRRAWIEISAARRSYVPGDVALLAEGVDRNQLGVVCSSLGPIVALLAEGVDRNLLWIGCVSGVLSRPPRGGRG